MTLSQVAHNVTAEINAVERQSSLIGQLIQAIKARTSLINELNAAQAEWMTARNTLILSLQEQHQDFEPIAPPAHGDPDMPRVLRPRARLGGHLNGFDHHGH